MARVKRRGKNWQLDYRRDGKRYRRSLGALTRSSAEELAREYENEVVSRRLGLKARQSPTLLEFCQHYFQYSRANHAPKTCRDIAYTFGKNLIPFFGKKRLSEIDTELIETFKSSRRGTVSDSTVNKDLRYLRSMLNYAKSIGKCDLNKVVAVKLLRVANERGRILELDEIELIHGCTDHMKPLYLTAIHTGLRAQELFNLTWENVDFENRIIKVSTNSDWHPKNYENRVVPMTDRLYDILLETKNRGQELVFTYEDGTKLRDVRSRINKLCHELGMKRFTLHDLRRTFCTQSGAVSDDVYSVQQAMGHSDVRTTMGYMRVGLSRMRSVINKLPYARSK